MLTPFDHAFAVLLAVLFPLWAVTFGFERLKRATPEQLPRVRRSVYRAAILLQWGLVACTIALWLVCGRSFAALGLVPVFNGGLVGTGIGFVIVTAFVLHQRAHILADPHGLDMVRRRFHSIERMMPHTRGDLRAFLVLSATAGVCEEILYRGFLIWYLGHGLALLPAAGVAAIVFGLGHSYQGPRGMALTGAVGAFLAAVYLLSGSLLVPILLHALMDMHSGHLAYVAYTRAAPERAHAAETAPAGPAGSGAWPGTHAEEPGADA